MSSTIGRAWHRLGSDASPARAHLGALAALAACGVGAVAIYAAAFSLPYSIAGGLARPLLDFAKISGPSPGSTVGLILAFTLLFGLYLGSLRLCRSLEGSLPALVTVGAVGSLAALALLPMYPVFSLDVFYYMAADRIWSVYRENPFLVPPLQAAHDPFFPYATWGHYPLPYGPFWPWISEAAGRLGGGEVPATLLAFKALAVAGYLVCLPLVLWVAAAAVPSRRLTALCIFAWNPLVLIELAGNAHNDAIALIPGVVALGLWTRRRTALAALAFASSFLVKATGVLLAPPLLWASLVSALGDPPMLGANAAAKQTSDQVPVWQSRLRPVGGLARWGATHLVPAIGLAGLAWIPFWSATGPVGFLREFSQHYQSVTAVLMAPVPAAWQPGALRVLQALLLVGFALYAVSQRRHLATGGPAALAATWRLTIVYFFFLSPFYVGWYMVWPVLLSAMLVNRRITLLTTLLCIGSLSTHLVQFVVVPLAGPSLGWAQVNSLAVLAAFGPFAAGWVALARWRGARLPALVSR